MKYRAVTTVNLIIVLTIILATLLFAAGALHRAGQSPRGDHAGKYPYRTKIHRSDDPTERAATSMLGLLTSHADFDVLHTTLRGQNADRPNILLGEFIFFRYFAISHHANRHIADDAIYAHLMAVFSRKIKNCFRLNPTLRAVGSSFEKFEEETRRRNDLLANGLNVIKKKDPGETDDARAALASFLITLRILYPELTIDGNSIPPAMIALIQREFQLAADRMKEIARPIAAERA